MSRAAGSPALLDRPAGEVVRLLALAELGRAATARRSLAAGEDPEALHDFRVALRRLRSQLRAFRAALGAAVPKKLGRELRRLAAATSPGRDAEVGLAWLATFDAPAAARGSAGLAALRARLTARHEAALTEARTELVSRFDRLERRLASRLSEWTVELAPQSEPESFRALAAAEIRRHRGALAEALGAIVEPAHEDEVHAARIEAKRVRYLLDPLAGALPEAAPALGRLRALQDLLGELNDLRVLSGELGELAAELEIRGVARIAREGVPARRRRPRERSGLLAIAERIAAERAARWHRLDEGWVGKVAEERAALDADLLSVQLALAP